MPKTVGRLSVRTSIFLLAVLLAGDPGQTSADSEQQFPDLLALNARIAAAIDDGATWPRSPVDVVHHLFSLEPVCPLSTTGVLAQSDTIAASSAVILFRHSLPNHPWSGLWLQAQLESSNDGTWRVERVAPYLEAQQDEAAARKRNRRQLGTKMTGFDVDLGPIELLQFLKERRGAWTAPLFPKEWIKEADLPVLVSLLHSTEPCAGVINMLSSVIDSTTSTVGNEAAYLLEGYISKRYPPRLISTRPQCDVREIELWWSKRQER